MFCCINSHQINCIALEAQNVLTKLKEMLRTPVSHTKYLLDFIQQNGCHPRLGEAKVNPELLPLFNQFSQLLDADFLIQQDIKRDEVPLQSGYGDLGSVSSSL